MDTSKNIIVGFSKSKDWWKIGSPIIAASEKRNYSHAYIQYTCPTTNCKMVLQSSGNFVNEEHLDNFLKHSVIVEEITIVLSDVEFLELLTWCKKCLGIPYSKAEILFIALKNFVKLLLKL